MPNSLSRIFTLWRELTPAERRRFGLMLAAIAGLNAAGWGLFLLLILPHNFK